MNISPIELKMKPTHQLFYDSLIQEIPKEQALIDPLSRYAYGTDASFYRYIPEMVIKAENEGEVKTILRLASEYQIAVTFRAAGTSLSGQTCSDSVIVIMGDDFYDSQIIENGHKIKLKPMVIGSNANKILAPFSRKIGPDPASINTARIGGIFANNSGGMCCGTVHNSYQTLDTVRLVFVDGTILDTSDKASIEAFTQSHAKLLESLVSLANEIKNNPELTEKVRRKYRIKNTTGYGINALLDFDDPIEILSHLMVGSEGTLGFVSEVTLKTIPDYVHKASALVFFHSLDDCCQAINELKTQNIADAVELLDASSIRYVAKYKDNLPPFVYSSFDDEAICLLIEVKAENTEGLNGNINSVNQVINRFNNISHSQFSQDSEIYSVYWGLRKGLLPIIGANRPQGSVLLIEDITFPLENLAEGIRSLKQLFIQYQYPEAVIMGHAFDGNLHFILTPNMSQPEAVQNYNQFMHALTDLVAIKFQGSMKGEHGTGRNVAPFVEAEWGKDAYSIMKKLKKLFDPLNILNPDVIITENPDIHLKNLKRLPKADDLVDRCIECGFCEPVCPSSGLSLTPRQRIAVWRRISDLVEHSKQTGKDSDELLYYKKHYPHQAIELCATTGMCALSCPVGINTGDLMKKLRQDTQFFDASLLTKVVDSSKAPLSSFLQTHFSAVTNVARFAFKASSLLGASNRSKLSKKLSHRFKGIPIIPEKMPSILSKKEIKNCFLNQKPYEDKAVYFLSCLNRIFSDNPESDKPIAEYTIGLLNRANIFAIYPENLESLCCGQSFEGVGNLDAANKAIAEVNDSLLASSNQGQYPIYLDYSACSLFLMQAQEKGLLDKRLKLFSTVGFLAEYVIPKIENSIEKKYDELTLHTPCSVTKAGEAEKLLHIAKLCSNRIIKTDIACCGFAGEKGFSEPELNQNSLRFLKHTIPDSCQHGVSVNSTCQLGLSNHTGRNFQSLEAILYECCAISQNL